MLQIRDIMEILPHRYPFLLVDRIIELEPGVRAVGIKNVTANEPQFTGHWPGNPVFPGVLILEAMAQVGGVLLLSGIDAADKLALFGGVDGARFRRQVIPGDVVRFEVEMLRRKSTIGKVKGVATVDDVVVAEAELLFALTTPPAAGSEE
ncbi:MAG: 3-hydroxyacyl-ACP dehydratase FabZ [candidate division WS1 bacterium]|jgi:3-hydroxyacyl-[acyl-carrier-protein] dehydratase|nr:3-hydroxyacyl-ACP dehydratase FabZ [candidate division WS1 bacterium]